MSALPIGRMPVTSRVFLMGQLTRSAGHFVDTVYPTSGTFRHLTDWRMLRAWRPWLPRSDDTFTLGDLLAFATGS
jgi:hypothetical protein